jgi:hypothetical protein
MQRSCPDRLLPRAAFIVPPPQARSSPVHPSNHVVGECLPYFNPAAIARRV